jgi:hypothetical protein
MSLAIFFFLWLYSPDLGLGLPPWNSPFHFGLLDLRHQVGLLGRVTSSSQGLYLYTNTEKRTYTHTHRTSMPWVGLKSTIPGSERAKVVHALDRSAIVTGHLLYTFFNYILWTLTALILWNLLSVNGKGEVVPVLSKFGTTPWRRMGEWMYRPIYQYISQWFKLAVLYKTLK